MPCCPHSNRLTSHRSKAFLLFQLTRSPCFISSAGKLCDLCGTTKEHQSLWSWENPRIQIFCCVGFTWAQAGLSAALTLRSCHTSGIKGMRRRDERLMLLLASDQLKRNLVTHSLGVFNHCQLNEAYSHVRRFTEFVWCDSEHETTPTLSNLGICVLWSLIIGMLMDGCHQIRLG